VSVTANNSVEPVAGGVITFTAPASGASAVFNGSPATIGSHGLVSVMVAANPIPGTYTVSATAIGVTGTASFSLTNVFGPASLVVTTLLDQNAPLGTAGLRAAILSAETQSGPQAITFDKSILTKPTGNVIDLHSALPDLKGNITIEGTGAKILTVQRDAGASAFRIFTVDAGAAVALSGLTISGGSATYGGGIINFGRLTVSDSTLSANAASIEGGGICNIGGTLTARGSSLSGNTASSGGGGLYNNGSLTLSSTLSGNSAFQGGGVLNAGVGTLTVSNSTLDDNSAHYGAGLWNRGTLTVNSSILSGNSAAQYGGGIDNVGTLTVNNSSVAGNSAAYAGGLFNASGTATLTNATLAQNSASISVGGIDAHSGKVLLHNTLVAGNRLKNSSVDKPSDVAYRLDSASDYNLIGDGRGGLSTAKHNLLGSSSNPINPLLAALGSYGGPTQTMALLPGSPAIDAGSSAYGGSTDQRGMPRVGNTDIGAFESQGFAIALSSGNNQKATANTAFAQPLVVSVTANNSVEPVAGGVITFTAPASGASAVFSSSPATIGSHGRVSVMATANPIPGTYAVSASATGIARTATFSLTNLFGPASLVVTTLLGQNNPIATNSLREAITSAETQSGPQTITFDKSILTKPTGNVIDLHSALPDLKGNITIEGPGAKILTVQRDAGASAFRIFTVDAGAAAALSALTISGGSATYGGGIINFGRLTVSDSTLSANTARIEGGGICNIGGTLTVSGSTLSGNTATSTSAGGGGIWNSGTARLSNSTLSGNAGFQGGGVLNCSHASLTVSDSSIVADNTAAFGGGIWSNSRVTLSNSSLSDNSATSGGGVCNGGRGTVTVSDSTLSGNRAVRGGGMSLGGSSTATVSASSLSGDSAVEGGGLFNSGSLTVNGSALSSNSATSGGGIYNLGILKVNNSTLCGNSAQYVGGLFNTGGTATLTNATLADNSASVSVGGIDAYSGAVQLNNTLVAGNRLKNASVNKPSDVAYGLDSASDYNLIGDGRHGLSTSNHNLLGTSTSPLNPLLAPLGNYSGSTQTMALLPGSPAIDAGSSAYGGSTDQRDKPRVGATDIGAFESQGFNIAISSGNNQSTKINTAFANPLVVSVTAKNAADPVAGGAITFTVPAAGASAVLKGSPATISSDGKASIKATANGTTGTYTVSAAASGIASPAKFSLTNTAAASPAITLPAPAATTMATAPSPQQASDQVMTELGRTWDFLLAGDNVHVLRNSPHAATEF
jgi:ethanolamine utilization microcompartment shell protein EutS